LVVRARPHPMSSPMSTSLSAPIEVTVLRLRPMLSGHGPGGVGIRRVGEWEQAGGEGRLGGRVNPRLGRGGEARFGRCVEVE
jgi:hypothetical protein